MPGNVFGKRSSTAFVQPWAATLGVGKAIFDYYDSQGDKTLSADTVVPSLLDGPMVVRRYNNLTLDASTGNVTLTTQNRCRGLMLLIDGNLTLQRSGSYAASISMTARGARGHAGMGLYDMLIPDSIDLQGQGFSYADVLKRIRQKGWAVIDRWLWDEWGKIAGVTATAWTGGTVLLTASGCGGASAVNGVVSSGVGGAGPTGTAGVSGGTGGGGGGGAYHAGSFGSALAGPGAPGRPWGGGAGVGGAYDGAGNTIASYPPDQYGGPGGAGALYSGSSGGGAGNPEGPAAGGGSAGQPGTGGSLIIVVRGNVSVAAGCVLSANGSAGGAGSGGGGGSGGGHVSIVYGGSYTNSGTVAANGGAGGAGSYSGGAGGAGSVVTKTFTQMGW